MVYIICEKNKNLLGDRFNKEGLYAGHITHNMLEELLESYNYDIELVMDKLIRQWGNGYKYFGFCCGNSLYGNMWCHPWYNSSTFISWNSYYLLFQQKSS